MNFFGQHAFLFCATLNIFSQHESLFLVSYCHNIFFCDLLNFGGQRNFYVKYFFVETTLFFVQHNIFLATHTKFELKEYRE